MFKRISLAILVALTASIALGQAFIWVDIDLEKRGEQASALSATQHDNNMTKLETAVNATGAAVETATTLGEMWMAGNAVATTTGDNNWHQVTGFTAGELEGTTFASDALVLPATIWYTTCSVSFSGTSGNIIQFGYGIDGTVDTQHIAERKIGVSGDVGVVSLVGYITVTEGQSLGLYVKNTNATADVTVKHATVISNRIL
jgi:hypothetical protein